MHNESIKYGVSRYKDFITVQMPNDRNVRLEAIERFAEAAGMNDDNWDTLGDNLTILIDPTSSGGELGWALVGFMMGLYAAERENELQ